MLVDLISVTTADGMRLDGALQLPDFDAPKSLSPIDAWLLLHGTGSNFYGSALLASLAARLVRTGAAVLRGNTRGHDMVSAAATPRGRRMIGAAFERVDESPFDIAAWVRLLGERGYQNVGLVGHSLGAVKAIYYLAQRDPPPVAALVAVSPPRLSHAHFLASPSGKVFGETYALAEQHVRDGQPDTLMQVTFPIPYIASAAAYVDRYHADERYNVLNLIQRVEVPTQVIYGSQELGADAAFAGMAEALPPLATEQNRLHVSVVAGADHQYSLARDALAERIEFWLRRWPA